MSPDDILSLISLFGKYLPIRSIAIIPETRLGWQKIHVIWTDTSLSLVYGDQSVSENCRFPDNVTSTKMSAILGYENSGACIHNTLKHNNCIDICNNNNISLIRHY